LNADAQIDGLLKRHAPLQVQRYLVSIASTLAAKEKTLPYFDKPRPEVVE
jgi:hypothetical protein